MADVLVLGATGTTGRRVVELLAGRGVGVRCATRKPTAPEQVRFEWHDRESQKAAVDGVRAVYLVAPIGVVDPIPLVEPFIDDALGRGVRRVVQLSSSALREGTPGLGAVHRLICSAVPEWTVLRPSWFMQNFSGDHAVAQGVRAGEIVTATGHGRIPFIDADDIAAVAVRALTDDTAHNTDHVLTGPQALSYADAADVLTRRLGRPIRHTSVPAEDYARRIAEGGVPLEFARVLAALETDIARGAEDRVTSTVEDVTGRAPHTFDEFCARMPGL